MHAPERRRIATERGFSFGGSALQQRFDQASMRPEVFNNEEAESSIAAIAARTHRGRDVELTKQPDPGPILEEPLNIPRFAVIRVPFVGDYLLNDNTGGQAVGHGLAPYDHIP